MGRTILFSPPSPRSFRERQWLLFAGAARIVRVPGANRINDETRDRPLALRIARCSPRSSEPRAGAKAALGKTNREHAPSGGQLRARPADLTPPKAVQTDMPECQRPISPSMLLPSGRGGTRWPGYGRGMRASKNHNVHLFAAASSQKSARRAKRGGERISEWLDVLI